jgi:hypothetical protein
MTQITQIKSSWNSEGCNQGAFHLRHLRHLRVASLFRRQKSKTRRHLRTGGSGRKKLSQVA